MSRPTRPAFPPWALPTAVAIITFIAFLPALHAGFVTWDDGLNFVDNPHYRGLGAANLGWMWTTFHLGHYVPLSWMTLGLDYELWGMNPAGYHLTSMLIHTANAVLVYFVVRRLLHAHSQEQRSSDGLTAAFAALFFAVHPLRVESVVWVTERRDVLSLFFALVCVLAYLRSCDDGERRVTWYWGSVALFVVAVLSKATVMTMPAVLLLLNVHPLRRIPTPAGWGDGQARRVYAEMIPFAVVSAALMVLSIVALKPPDQLAMADKFALSAFSICFYLWKTVAPFGLSHLYPQPVPVHALAPMFLASYVGVAAFFAAIWQLRRRRPGAATALLAFFIITLPMLGVVQNGPQIAADRYTYHAAPAIAMLAACSLALLAPWTQAAPRVIGTCILAALAGLTWLQAGVWHSSETLWTHAIRLDSSSAIAHTAYASLLYQQNRVPEAIEQGDIAVALAPENAEAHDDVGIGLMHQGKFAEAIGQFQRALSLAPSYAEAEGNLGLALAHQRDFLDAIGHYQRALSINPQLADAHVNWGNTLIALGRPTEAIAHYQEALRIRPDHADAQLDWGVALAQQGDLADAIVHFRLALTLNPALAEARDYLEKATRMSLPPSTRERE